ncbi:MAG TPA: dipeptide epimerase [Gaiellales bacterium]|nr:dipeptide epimerase [Gaiellales bacterium]
MELTARLFTVELAEPFVISRNTTTSEDIVQVAITHDGVTGYGEGAPDERYGESCESAMAFFERARTLLGDDPFALEATLGRIGELPGEMAAKCAIDGALHDLMGKLAGQPLWRLFGLDPTPPPTSYTISIDTLEGTADRARRAAGFHALKIKVGGPGDLDRVRAVREQAPDALIRVDANEAWTVEFTREIAPELVSLGVELIEQPLHADQVDGYRELHAASLPIPIVLDESVHTLPDVGRAGGIADGVNIKLTKSGGIREAHRMIHAARALGLKVMLGCMNETSLGIAAAVQLSPLVDVVDLDGHLLNANDAFTGLGFVDGAVVPSDLAGLGVTPLEQWP